MTIFNDGIPLEAVLDLPEKQSENTPLMILVHGFTGYKEEPHLNAMAEMMTGLGFAVLRPDLYGHGKSGGHFRDHTIWKWLSDITALIDYARKDLPYREIWLCGHSQGGLAVMLAAAMHRDRIKGVVALAPALTIPVKASIEYAGRFRDAELAVIPGDSHCYDYHLDEAVAAVRDWLERKM